jgi:hypothetical protein
MHWRRNISAVVTTYSCNDERIPLPQCSNMPAVMTPAVVPDHSCSEENILLQW